MINRWVKTIWPTITLAMLVVIPVAAQELTQGFSSDEELLRGAIVSRVEGDEAKVEGATQENNDRLYGVVVRSNETPIALTNEFSGILVANSGRYEMLVTDVNGAIKEGDYLTTSPVRAIAMKADDRQTKIVAQALQNFDVSEDANQKLASKKVRDQNGQEATANIGRILVDMNVRGNPLAFGIQAPEVLIELGEAIAGGPVSVTRIWGALGTLVLSFITGSVIFYAGVRTSIIAIGRNPLSKSSVLRGFFQVTAISFIIFVVGGFAVYLILKL